MTTGMNAMAFAKAHTADLCIVGPGYGGRLIAAKAIAAGATVTYVHNHKPSSLLGEPAFIARSFIEAANLYHAAHTIAPKFLREAQEELTQQPPFSNKALIRHTQRANEALSLPVCDAHLKSLQVSFLKGRISFPDNISLLVDEQRVLARYYVLSPASTWETPAIPGLNEIDYLTPDRPIAASQIKRLVVLGISGTALALAQAHRHLGTAVTLVPFAGSQSAQIDDEIMRQALMSLEYDGVELKLDAPVLRIEAQNHNAIVHTAQGEALRASHVLVAPPLHPLLPDIDWSKTGIQINGHQPKLDRFLRTSNRRIYMIGASAKDEIFSTALEHEANLIIDHALLRRTPPPVPTMQLIPTSPEIAVVGLNEDQARQHYRKIQLLRSSYRLHPLKLAHPSQKVPTSGEIKIIATHKGRIIGCSIIGDCAADIAGLWSLAIARKLTLRDLSDLHFPDLSHHSITRQALSVSIFGWQPSFGLWLRLSRLWNKLWAKVSPHE